MLFSAACERNKEAILAVLQDWLPPQAQVLEIGSGSAQHAVFFVQSMAGLVWQTSELTTNLADLDERIALEGRSGLAPGSLMPRPIALDVSAPVDWPHQRFDAVFTANTTHIMPASSVPDLLAGAAAVLVPGGILLLYGPFSDHGIPMAASNVAFDLHLRSLDPAMGVRDAVLISEQANGLGLSPLADVAMPANNRTLIFRRNA
jgi:cyclopropane fatty-acyl-phospholipid synthase-like methyltransferase